MKIWNFQNIQLINIKFPYNWSLQHEKIKGIGQTENQYFSWTLQKTEGLGQTNAWNWKK